MQIRLRFVLPRSSMSQARQSLRLGTVVVLALLVLPLAAHAQSGSSPFDTGFTSIQNLFTGTVAKVASLVAIVNAPSAASPFDFWKAATAVATRAS